MMIDYIELSGGAFTKQANFGLIVSLFTAITKAQS